MDIMTLSSTDLKSGKIVNGTKKVEWIERYSEPGEFTIIVEPTEDARTQLALGTLITHMDTQEVMMVEDHEIDESEDEVTLTVTGRSITSFFLENRTGSYNSFPMNNAVTDVVNQYEFISDTLIDNFTVYLQEQLTSGVSFLGGRDVIPTLTIEQGFTGTDTPRELVVKRGFFQQQVKETLEQLDAGLQFLRPIDFGSGSRLRIHKGTDLSATVVFASEYGDLENTRYFWSNRKYKNTALVVGKYSSKVIAPTTFSGFTMRAMWVDASDYAFNPSISGSAADLDKADRVLTQRGEQALGNQRMTTLIETGINPNNRWRYRTDYNLGDIVMIRGNYGVSQAMRVVEFAEFEDETGEVGVPTVKPLAS